MWANATDMVSVSSVCVFVRLRSLLVYVRSKRNESECLDMCTCDRPWSWLLGLERWCMQPENCKVRRNSGGCSWRYWRANHSLCFVLGRKTNRTIRITETEQLYQVKADDWRNRERAVFDLFSNIKWVNSQAFLWWTSEARDNSNAWAIHGKQKIVDKRWTQHPVKMIMNMIKNTCFTDEKRHRVYVQNVPVCTGTTRIHVSTCVRVVPVHTGTFWTYTRGRVEWTHGVSKRVTH